jgi:excisionase family DNA binding protein
MSHRELSEAPDAAPVSGPFTVKEAARSLALSERTIRRAIQRGELGAAKRGKAFQISGDALARYRDQRARVSEDGAGPWLMLLPAPADPAAGAPSAEGPGDRGPVAFLPAPLTRFVGRERETAAIADLLRDDAARLVTLTGPGGVGKTRLALRVAAEVVPEFAAGAAFVPLAPVRSADLVLATIILALGVRTGEDKPPLDRLRTFLRERELLLVLDNFEHLTHAGPSLIELLVGCPRLTLLVTSRAPLRLTGERVVAVPPLALPALHGSGRHGADRSPLAEMAGVESVRLFVDRAQTATGDFRLTADNAAVVAAICEQSDGLPLAIEFAAARTALLSPEALLARLKRRLRLLTGGPRDQPDRLRTMRDAIAWSYDLLSPEERACFRRLAVFVGGCTIDAAEFVEGVPLRSGGVATLRGRHFVQGAPASPQGVKEHAGMTIRSPSPPSPPESAKRTTPPEPKAAPPALSSTLDLVQSLVDQAILQRQSDGADEPRFGMLETIREFGLEQLAASGEETALRDAHAAWCVTLAERAEPELAGPNQTLWVRRLEADLGNIRAALDWLAERGAVEDALRLAGAIGWFWSSAPYFEEARVRFDVLLALPGVERAPALLGKVLQSAGDVADWQGDQPRARAHYERALAIYRELDDRWRMAAMLRGLGSSAIDRGELDLASDLLEESLALAREVDNAWEEAAASNLLGTLAAIRGNFAEALPWHEEAAAGWRNLADTGHVVVALSSGGWAALLAREQERAAAAYHEALLIAVAGEDEWYIAWCIAGAGALTSLRGDPRLGIELLALGARERERIGVPLRPRTQDFLDAITADLRTRIGDDAFQVAWHVGRALCIADATARAFAMLAAVNVREPAPHGLTRRERDVLMLLVDGQSDKEIAQALFISPRTASSHVAAILAKLGADSRTAAVTLAHRERLV